MYTLKRQRGMSMSSWMIVIGLFGFFITLLFKMGPAYLDNYSVRSALKSMANSSPNLHDNDPDEIYSVIGRYFQINGVRNVKPKDMKIVKELDRTLINHDYETRVPIFFNIDVVMKFRNQVDSSNIEACCEFLVEDEQEDKSSY